MLFLFMLAGLPGWSQAAENWTSKQLIEPAALAKMITDKRDVPVIISVGPGAPIPGSVNVGMVNNAEGIGKLKKELAGVSKQAGIVIYCGCCPFEHCPNVRPAIDMLKQMQFTGYQLLNIPNNIKKDWIDKGYPTTN
ncbi:rhodanese-like domain-containing protein [Segetibacter sp. 3557_3]|uniref:rhodanese-like domain-containing protein n=1 Tax=Segetibacter sp. 3557_3 TaxID=2547429 RepID=UPI001FB5F863|nr:rhodanese-like domain-containing protein [Segetibacter sp. 3557_3]